jgi:HEAT repeat protein
MRSVFAVCLALLLSGCGQSPPLTVRGKPVSHWVQALENPDARVRRKAVGALGNVGAADAQVVPALVRAVKDRDARVRAAAVLALLKIGPEAREAVPALTAARRDRDAQVRAYAAKALAKVQEGN